MSTARPGRARTAWVVACAALALGAVGACGGDGSQGGDAPRADGYVDRSQFGEDWPLTVPSGELGCAGDGSLTFTTADGTTYAVHSSETTQHLPRWDAIWADDPTQRGGKKPIAAFMERGTAFCRGR